VTIIDPTKNPHFIESVRLLCRLHELIRNEQDESPEGEAIRDAMDYPWWQMSEREQELVGGLSADLYSIGAARAAPPSPPHGIMREADSFIISGRGERALELLRKHEHELPPDFPATLRGLFWFGLREFDVAVTFFSDAVRLNPSDAKLEMLRLVSLARTSRLDEAVQDAERILAVNRDPMLLLAASAVFVARAAREPNSIDELFVRKALEAVERALAMVGRPGDPASQDVQDEVSRRLLAGIYFRKALCLAYVGRFDEAADACRRSLLLEPHKEPVFELLGQIDFRRHCASRLPATTPFLGDASQEDLMLLGTPVMPLVP
jgi:tetratricopeptide (TPR) repeat protein